MVTHSFKGLFVSLFLLTSIPSLACTSVIISGRLTADGRPVMYKHRDTSNQNNGMEYFRGEKYGFIGLVNKNWRTSPVSSMAGGKAEVWAGRNTAGFCIMNTATYDLKDDDVPASEMDREGVVMYRALEICRTVSDFERMLDTLTRPMGVEANFGVIDADGGAAYYEVNNHKWIKFDVNETSSGYMVVTNFTRTGRKADRRGEDRYEKACNILKTTTVPASEWNHEFLIENISRSGAPIMRDISASAIIFEGSEVWASVGKPDKVPCLRYYVSSGNVKSSKKHGRTFLD